MRIGAVLPMLRTATGLAFAAFLPRQFDEPLIKRELDSDDNIQLFVRDLPAVKRLLVEVRKQGYAFNEGHLMSGVSAVAFPLIDRTATLVAVIAVMGRHERLKPPEGAEMISYLRRATRDFGK